MQETQETLLYARHDAKDLTDVIGSNVPKVPLHRKLSLEKSATLLSDHSDASPGYFTGLL